MTAFADLDKWPIEISCPSSKIVFPTLLHPEGNTYTVKITDVYARICADSKETDMQGIRPGNNYRALRPDVQLVDTLPFLLNLLTEQNGLDLELSQLAELLTQVNG
jgi:hypothetical protein